MNAAQTVLDRHWDGNLPVDVAAIARAEGVDLQPTVDPSYSGEIERTEGDRIVIRYNFTESTMRQRFTIAHEIGHLELGHLSIHKRLPRDTPDNFSSTGTPMIERHANAFAAALLMPENIIKYMITVRGITGLRELCDLFGVSPAAMKYRLKNIGVIHG